MLFYASNVDRRTRLNHTATPIGPADAHYQDRLYGALRFRQTREQLRYLVLSITSDRMQSDDGGVSTAFQNLLSGCSQLEVLELRVIDLDQTDEIWSPSDPTENGKFGPSVPRPGRAFGENNRDGHGGQPSTRDIAVEQHQFPIRDSEWWGSSADKTRAVRGQPN